jgi:hypothetical protein
MDMAMKIAICRRVEYTVNEVTRYGELKRRLLMLIGSKMVVQCGCHVKKCMKADDVGVGCGYFGVYSVDVDVDG